MTVDREMVQKIAVLARLQFDEKEIESYIQDMNKIIAFVEKLNELDTSGVEPLVYITEEKNVLRPDTIREEITKEEALKNAPQRDSDYFKVPKVIRK